jgi:cytochrome c-type protein NapB
MKHSLVLRYLFIVSFTFILPASMLADEVTSLRGSVGLEAESVEPEIKRWESDQEPIERDYVQQPPLIPHTVESYKINQQSNKCLTCHSWSTYRKSGATKISQTHFADRDENVLADIAPRRYFCNQCHVPQRDAKPLVGNTFEPVPAVQQP